MEPVAWRILPRSNNGTLDPEGKENKFRARDRFVRSRPAPIGPSGRAPLLPKARSSFILARTGLGALALQNQLVHRAPAGHTNVAYVHQLR